MCLASAARWNHLIAAFRSRAVPLSRLQVSKREPGIRITRICRLPQQWEAAIPEQSQAKQQIRSLSIVLHSLDVKKQLRSNEISFDGDPLFWLTYCLRKNSGKAKHPFFGLLCFRRLRILMFG